MALVLDESFATGIPANFATARTQAGTLSASYNSTAQAVDLSNGSAGQSIWDITSVPLTVAGEMEIDLELVADLSGTNNYRHAGAWVVAGQSAVSNGYRLAHLQSNWMLSRWDGSVWSGETGSTSTPQGVTDTFNAVGDRRVLNLRWDMASAAGVTRLSLEARIDGALRLVTAGTFPSLRPGIFLYQATVRLHSIKAWDAPQAPLTDLGFRAFAPSEQRRVLTVPEASASGIPSSRFVSAIAQREFTVPQARSPGGPVNYFRGLPLAYRNTYQGGQGRVAGTVKVKGSPDVPVQRKVRLIDEFTGLMVREVFSDPVTGAYEFLYVSRDHKYTVVSYDWANNFRAVLADNITAEYVA